MRMSSSGLPYPLRFSARSRCCERIVAPGLPLGVFDDGSWDELRVPLDPGDVFVFFTDGVTEADGGEGEFGTERLGRIVEENAHAGAATIGTSIVSAALEFLKGRALTDDLTVVVVKVKG
jgi:sigma-B regulation protein RsbU (phosphoserine phosphatase)